MADTAVDFLLETLEQLIRRRNYPINILGMKDQIESLHEEFQFLRTFLEDSEDQRYDHEQVQNLVAQIRDVAYETQDIIDSFVVLMMKVTEENYDDHVSEYCSLMKLGSVMELEIKSIKTQVMEIYDKKIMYCIGKSSYGSSSKRRKTTTPLQLLEEAATIVGFDDEATTILEKLTGEQKQLDVVSITGMPGLGKTTLARKMYKDPYVVYQFRIRAWIHVSRAYRKRDSLLGILSCIVALTDDQIHKMSDERLCEELYWCLKGRRYLIVIDDIWNIEVWDDLKGSFPDDSNGSRIMLTSRLTDVALYAKPDSPPHSLRFLTEDESWDLFQHKVFWIWNESCPPVLIEIGKEIAKKCQGLPLAIVVIAGVLANEEKSQDCWKQVAESVGSYIATDPEQYMNTLALSYNHLPHHLQVCFLYLGAFPEGYEIPVRKLIWLWMGEGFIRKEERKRLEEEGEDCLMDLIGRSLVIVSQKRSSDGIKACRIHGLLHDLCLRKAKEEKFLQHIDGSDSAASSSLIPIDNKQRRLCIHSHAFNYISSKPSALHVRSLLCFAFEWRPLPRKKTPFVYQAFKLLRVLDLKSIGISIFPSEIEQLVHLRYLALRAVVKSLPPSITNLLNLEILIVEGLSGAVTLPYNIGKMVKLRHVYIKGETYIPRTEPTNSDYPFVSFNLQTIATLGLYRWNERVLTRIPNIRKLGCIFVELWDGVLPRLDFLFNLETLNVSYRRETQWPVTFPPTYKFPSNLKKITLSKFRLSWSEISIFGKLPNLEVLKLLDEAFKGPQWDTNEGEFLQLKFLKLEDVDIEQWNASSDHFPSLQRLVLRRCKRLEEIPYDLGEILTLEMIDVCDSNRSAMNSAKQIQKQQQDMGNDVLKIFIYPRIEEEEEEDDDASGE